MNLSTAELHVRAITRDTLNEQAADEVLGNEDWLAAEIDLVVASVTRAEELGDPDGLKRGLDAYADDLRERLAGEYPDRLLDSEDRP